MIYIYGPNSEIARQYAIRNGITAWHYVDDVKILKGMEGKTLIILDGWEKGKCIIKRVFINRAFDKFKEHNIILYRGTR